MSGFTISPTNPLDGGTAVIEMTFTDEDGEAVVPTGLEWQLSDKFGDVIGTMTFANGSFTGDTIVLSGTDLVLADADDSGERYFGVKGLYDSSAGTGLSLVGELKFTILDLKNIVPA